MGHIHNSSTTPEQMEALLSKYGARIAAENWSRAKVQQETGLGDNAARRLQALARGLPTGKRFFTRPKNLEAAKEGVEAPQHQPTTSTKAFTVDLGKESGTVESGKEARLLTPEELLARAGVDLAVWEVDRAIVNKWDMGSAPRRVGSDKDGWRRPSNDPQVTELYSVKVYLKRRKDTLDIIQFKADALAEIRAAAAPLNRRFKKHREQGGQLLYVGAHDVHVGKLALSAETLSDYNSAIARDLALSSLDALLAQAAHHGISRIVLPVGHDLTHFESGSYGTSAGTPQDPDGRYRIMRRLAYQLMVEMVQRAAQYAPVDVIGVPGNHGRDTDLAIAERLEARFEEHPNVKVLTPLTPRAYYQYGTNLLGLTHGDRIKRDTLPLIMADEMREAWASTTHREWLLGHFHAKQAFQYMQTESEFRSVRVRVLPSISATDYWHAVCGYSNVRAMEAYRYSLSDGYVGHHSVAVRPAGRAA